MTRIRKRKHGFNADFILIFIILTEEGSPQETRQSLSLIFANAAREIASFLAMTKL
jgi:hypothetical protein